jgi:hypothetical protein
MCVQLVGDGILIAASWHAQCSCWLSVSVSNHMLYWVVFSQQMIALKYLSAGELLSLSASG